ncbi:hypothetical protein KFK09_018950 [Dendrobium nobile]|uniref:Uncharacterized protein n=1 Tax=Dendrobium nobile TaxID=94219 RepID=A0A8T3AXD2_DENNO|nr:hypothetical protein KFK09_018950 [Dendrobium nobile]
MKRNDRYFPASLINGENDSGSYLTAASSELLMSKCSLALLPAYATPKGTATLANSFQQKHRAQSEGRDQSDYESTCRCWKRERRGGGRPAQHECIFI